MKQQLNNLFYTSPLEQFENNAVVFKHYQPMVPDVYLNGAFNMEFNKMVEYEANYFFDVNTFSFLQDKVSYIAFIAILFLGLGVVLNTSKETNFFKIFNKQFFSGWLIAKLFTIFMTITAVSFEYIVTNVPVEVAENQFMNDIKPFIFPVNHGGFILNDSMCFFISAVLFLYLCTAFQDFNNSKGPFIANKNPLTSLQLSMHKVTVDLLGSSIDKDVHSQSYHAFVYGLFTYLVVCNVQGLIPFTITVTSHLICTFFSSSSSNVICSYHYFS